jgi:hypothetical protein
MRQAGDGGYAPSVALRAVPWGGNGYYAADNDVFGASRCLEQAARLWLGGGEALEAVLESGRQTAAAYGPGERQAALGEMWPAAHP